jgi:hypothetical protein
MTKEDILNGMSEDEFYQLYPTKEAWEQATQMKLGGLSGAPHNGQPTADQFFNYGSHALDKFNIPFGHFAYGGGPIYPAKLGGLPCHECGGMHKAQYGFNSGVNYGSFTVPMQVGGDPTSVWLAGEQMALQKKTKAAIPSDVKPTGTNPLYYNPFLKGSDIAKPDSMHTSPYDPNIAAYFKGDKVIAGPATDTGKAKQAAMKLNKGKMFVKDGQVFPNYMQQEGGAYDPGNAGTYPVLDFGGLKSIIDATAKNMKKSYGGDLTEQGGNQDFKKQYRATFDNYIKQNTYNAMIDQEHQAMLNEFQNMPYAQAGKQVGNLGYKVPVNTQREALEKQLAEKQNQQQTLFGSLADMYAPSVNRKQMSVFGSLFPANFTRGYEFSNADYARLKKMGDQGQITGITENYGPLARMLGKTGRRMFGPKSVTIGMMGPGSTSDQQQSIQNVGAGAYDNPLEGMDQGQLFKDYNKGVTPVGKQRADFMSSKLKNPMGPQIDPWTEMMNAAPEVTPPAVNAEPDRSNMQFVAGQWIQKAFGGAYQQGGNPISYSEVNLNRKYSGQEDLWKYAPGAFNFLAQGIESRHDTPEMKAAQLALMTPGSDMGPFQSVPATGRRMGDYDTNSGMFRPNQMIPIQFPGYAQWGGFNTMQSGGSKSKTEIDQLKNRFNVLDKALYGNNKQYIKQLAGSKNQAKREADSIQQVLSDYYENRNPTVPEGSTWDQFKQGFSQGIDMWMPNQNTWDQFKQGFTSAYKQEGGVYEEGEEIDLSPEKIAELRAQGYEIEELD